MIIENFHIVKQKSDNTCGYATAGMIVTFLKEQAIDEEFLIKNDPFDKIGITFTKLMEVYQKYLKNYRAEIVHGEPLKMMEIIKDSINAGIPLHIQHLTGNLMGRNEPVLHYAAVIGYDEDAETGEDVLVIADPYGFTKTMNKHDFFSSISFRNEGLPEIVKQKYPSHMMIRFTKKWESAGWL